MEPSPSPIVELADAVRRLIRATVLTGAPDELLTDAAGILRAEASRLENHVPDPPPSIHGGDVNSSEMAERMPRDAVIGRCNPLALPVVMSFDPPGVVGRGRFTSPYEGPPGCVQGGVIASTFDIVLSAASFAADAAGPTVSLTLRYRRPTRLHVESVFEAQLDRRENGRTFTSGRLLQDGVVTVEAQAVFADIGRDRTLSLGAS